MGKSQGRDTEKREEAQGQSVGLERTAVIVQSLAVSDSATGTAVCQASLASTTSWSLLGLRRVWYQVERAANVREAEPESWETTRTVTERKPRKPEAEDEHRPAAERSGADAQLWHPGILVSRKCPQTLLSAPSGQNQPQ